MGNAKTKEERKIHEAFCTQKAWDFLTLGNPEKLQVSLFHLEPEMPCYYIIRENNKEFILKFPHPNSIRQVTLNVKWLTDRVFELNGRFNGRGLITIVVYMDEAYCLILMSRTCKVEFHDIMYLSQPLLGAPDIDVIAAVTSYFEQRKLMSAK